MRLERGTNKTEVRWNQVLPLEDTEFLTQRETEIAETAYQLGLQSHPAPTPDLLLTDEENYIDLYGKPPDNRADLEIWLLCKDNFPYSYIKDRQKAQLSHTVPLVEQRVRKEIGEELEKVVDDNYKDRVILWDVLKDFIASLKAGEPPQGGSK